MLYLAASLGIDDSGRLDNGLFDALDEHPVAGGNAVDLDAVASVVDPDAADLAVARVLLVLERVVLAEYLDLLVGLQRAAEHAPVDVEGGRVRRRVVLGRVNDERTVRVARQHGRDEASVRVAAARRSALLVAAAVIAAVAVLVARRVGLVARRRQTARVDVADLVGGVLGRRGQVLGEHVGEAGELAEEAGANEPQERPYVVLELGLGQPNAELVERVDERRVHVAHALREDLVERFEHELDERSLLGGRRRLGRELARLGVEVAVAPQLERQLAVVERRRRAVVHARVYLGKRLEREAEAIVRAGEAHVAEQWRE